MKIRVFIASVVIIFLTVEKATRTAASVDHESRSSSDDILLRRRRSVCQDRSSRSSCQSWRTQGYCRYYRNYCQKTCGYCTVRANRVTTVCTDKHSYCSTYAGRGYCSRTSQYRRWMEQNCAKACRFCTPSTPRPTRCANFHRYCQSWANRGECLRNPVYMRQQCKKSCRLCPVPTTKKPTPKKTTLLPTTLPKKTKPSPKKTTLLPTTLPKKTKPLPTTLPKKTKPSPRITTRKPVRTCGRPVASTGRIVGGRFALPTAWPWHVAISLCKNCSTLPFCGGTLVDNEWIVTAAHCVQNFLASDLFVILGDSNLQKRSGHEISMEVKSIYMHNDYAIDAQYDNDIALLRLKNRVTFSDHIKPACLADSNQKLPTGLSCTVTGFGRTSENGRKTPRLMQADVPLKSNSDCEKLLGRSRITSSMLCAGYARGGIDSCKGDSGGPLVCRSSDGSWQLTGVVSWGIGCARRNKYGVYADVRSLRKWIDKTLGQNINSSSG